MVQVVRDSVVLANDLRPVLLRIARRLRYETTEFGVTAGQETLLGVIEGHPGISARELADSEHISPPGVSAHLDRLEAAQLIVRTRGADRRRLEVTLSPDGERVLQSVRARRTTWLAERLERLGDEDRAAIEAAIESLVRLLEAESA